MRLFLACNFEDELVHGLEDLAKTVEITLYGKLPFDMVGGGRQGYSLPAVDFAHLSRFISLVHKKGMRFNYLLNGTCFSGLESDPDWIEKVLKWAEKLVETGTDEFTVAHPELLFHLRKRFPKIWLNLSANIFINSIRKAEYAEELGASEITVDANLNRDFDFLTAIKKKIKTDFVLIANLCCLYQCPLIPHHSNTAGHGSQSGHPTGGFSLDFCSLKCQQLRLKRPQELIRSTWIRPEDIHHYEKIGLDKFKLVERNKSSDELIKITRAYIKREWKGNLIELMGPFTSPDKLAGKPVKRILNILWYLFRPSCINIFKLPRLGRVLTMPRFRIENEKLDGFLEFFLRDGHRCRSTYCSDCGHCSKFAQKAVVLDMENRQLAEKAYDELIEEIINGKIFSYFNLW